MDEGEREAHLDYLQACADGPSASLEIHERSLGKALVCAVLALSVAAVGLWLTSLPLVFGPQTAAPVKWLLWGCGLPLLAAGLAGLALAEALRRRHGKRVLGITPDTLCFANSPAPIPWHTFDAFDIDQRHLSTLVVFSVSASSRAPELYPACYKSLVTPDASALAGGLRVKVWACTPTLAGRALAFEELTDLLYAYLEAAQARRTLGQLFPAVERLGAQG